MATLEKIKSFLAKNRALNSTVALAAVKSTMILLTSYLGASTINSFSVTLLGDMAMAPGAQKRVKGSLPQVEKPNYRLLQRAVIKRNVFNSDGELPEEVDPKAVAREAEQEFDENAKCVKSSLGLSLIGTITLGPNSSLATIREKGFAAADIYTTGDPIIDHEDAVIYAIEQRKVVLNNGGKKECLEISTPKGRGVAYQSDSIQSPSGQDEEAETDIKTVTLTSSYVEEALGAGFSKILESGRLVPHNRDNKMVGFKLIGVKTKSLWRKVGLKSGDVITNVNDISMTQPDQGFALYQALQDERKIRVEYLKKGKTATTINIEIK